MLEPGVGASGWRSRCADVVLELSTLMKDKESGCLIQIWLPEYHGCGTTLLSTKDLPYSITGMGDLLALFRCMSCRFKFSTDVLIPSKLGAVGRVFTTLQPEMCCDLQRYEKQVYMRVQEAQRCSVHSTVLLPIFRKEDLDQPLGVLELLKTSRDICFPQIMDHVAEALSKVKLYGPQLKIESLEIGLRCWPLNVDVSFDFLRPGDSYGSVANHDEAEVQGPAVHQSLSNILTGKGECSAESHIEAGNDTQHLETRVQPPMKRQLLPDTAQHKQTDVQDVYRVTASTSPNAASGPTGQGLQCEQEPQRMSSSTRQQTGIPVPGCPSTSKQESEEVLDAEKLKILMDILTGPSRRKRKPRKVKMGCGKNLTFEQLKDQFGYGLKEAAGRLGICTTTLKRACRRNGIHRWPCRQITKLNKAMKNAGYSGDKAVDCEETPKGVVDDEAQQKESGWQGKSGKFAPPSGTIGIPTAAEEDKHVADEHEENASKECTSRPIRTPNFHHAQKVTSMHPSLNEMEAGDSHPLGLEPINEHWALDALPCSSSLLVDNGMSRMLRNPESGGQGFEGLNTIEFESFDGCLDDVMHYAPSSS